jgi:diguanylate cyclase (GGDEF)-like protein
MSRPTPVLLAWVGVVTAAGAAGAVWAGLRAGDDPTGRLGITLVVLAVLSANSTIPIPRTGVRVNADTAFLLALIALGADHVAALVAGFDMAMASLVGGTGRKRPHTVPFNAAAGLLGALGAGAVFRMGDGAWLAPAPLLGAALAMFAVNTVVVAVAIRVASGALPQAWREGLVVTAIGYVAAGSVAWLLASVPDLVSSVVVATPLVGVIWLAWRSWNEKTEERAERLREREQLFLPTLEALVAAIEARDEKTHGHNRRVRSYAIGLARLLGGDEQLLTAIGYGALLHDVGKIAIPDALLHAGRALTPDELTRVRRHASIGSDLIRHVPFPAGVVEVVRHHHERWDGAGYPDGLAGEQIPLAARIVAVCEAYDDQRTGGGWRPGCSHAEALAAIENDGGTAFDPIVLAAFLRWQRATPASEDERLRWTAANDAIRDASLEQARLHEIAWRDELTGIANGRALRRDLARMCEGGGLVGVLMMDLDGFKGVNDHFGHAAGDEALRIVGQALAALESPERRAYRNGGDEFVVLVAGGQELERHAVEIRDLVEQGRIPVSEREYVPLRVSIGGVALRGAPDALLKAADEAMYAVKQRRKAGKPRGGRPDVFPMEQAS